MGLATMPTPWHWANANCAAWWLSLPSTTGGSRWDDLFGRYPMTFLWGGGTANTRRTGVWSPGPSPSTPDYTQCDTVVPRPGAIGTTYPGPFNYTRSSGSVNQLWYGSTGVNLSAVAPTQGSLAMWVCFGGAINSTKEIWSCGTSTSAGLFDLQTNWGGSSASLSAGYYHSAEYRAVQSAFITTSDLGKWIHIGLTWKVSDYCRLYKNGVLAATAGSAMPSSYSISGGCYLGTTTWTARDYFAPVCVDDFSIWNRQFTAAEIQRVYEESAAGWLDRLTHPYTGWKYPATGFTATCAGGMPQGGDPAVVSVYFPVVAGGLRDGAESPRGATFAPVAAGGVTDGGEAPSFVGHVYICSAAGGVLLGAGIASPTIVLWPATAGGTAAGAVSSTDAAYAPSAAGGTAAGGEGEYGQAHVYVAAPTGGIRDGGRASVTRTCHPAASGGLVDGAGASARYRARHRTTGGTDQSGASPWIKVCIVTASGGLRQGSGAAATKTILVSALLTRGIGGVVSGLSKASLVVASGGIAEGGALPPALSTTCYAVGGLRDGGQGGRAGFYRPAPVGGFAESGDAPYRRRVVATASGGLTDGGSASPALAFDVLAFGGLTESGSSSHGRLLGMLASGGVRAGAQGPRALRIGVTSTGGQRVNGRAPLVVHYIVAPAGGPDLSALAEATVDYTSYVASGGASSGAFCRPVPTVQIREAVYDRLATCPQIVAATGDRIYFGALPQTCRLDDGPAIVFFVVSRTYGRSLHGPDGTSQARFHIAACAFSEAAADELSQLIRSRMQGFAGVQYQIPILSCKLQNDLDTPQAPVVGSDQWVYQVGSEYLISHRVRLPSFVPRPS